MQGSINKFGGISIVIPAYDELLNLRVLLPEVHKVLVDLPHYYPNEVLVVLPSFARTNEITEINRLGAKTVIRMPTNSFGDAIRTGFAAVSSSSEFVVTLDADGSHNPSIIPKMLAVVTGAHVVTGSRYTEGGTTDASLLGLILSRLLILAFSTVFGRTLSDHGNFKLYRKTSITDIELSGKNFDVIQELLFKIKIRYGRGFVIKEVPYHLSQRNTGRPKRKILRYIISYLKTLTKLLFMKAKLRFIANRKLV